MNFVRIATRIAQKETVSEVIIQKDVDSWDKFITKPIRKSSNLVGYIVNTVVDREFGDKKKDALKMVDTFVKEHSSSIDKISKALGDLYEDLSKMAEIGKKEAELEAAKDDLSVLNVINYLEITI